eukprot:CFRG5931T1
MVVFGMSSGSMTISSMVITDAVSESKPRSEAIVLSVVVEIVLSTGRKAGSIRRKSQPLEVFCSPSRIDSGMI